MNPTIGSLRAYAFLALALTLAAVAPAAAEVPAPLAAAFDGMAAAHSYHMSIAVSGMATEADYLPPDRIHGHSNGAGMTIETVQIGAVLYVNTGAGWQKQAATSDADSLDPARDYELHHAQLTGSDLGIQTIEGVRLHAYRIDDVTNHATCTAYLDAAGHLVRMKSADLDITYSRLNAPVTILAPM